jgi:hypothetical protein
MIKTLQIDGRDIRFKATMSLTYRFQSQFGKDILKIIWPILRAALSVGAEKELSEEVVLEALEEIEATDILNIIWTMAKSADPSIPEPVEWYDEFEHFPLDEVAMPLFELLINSMQSSEKLKKKAAQEMKKLEKK